MCGAVFFGLVCLKRVGYLSIPPLFILHPSCESIIHSQLWNWEGGWRLMDDLVVILGFVGWLMMAFVFYFIEDGFTGCCFVRQCDGWKMLVVSMCIGLLSKEVYFVYPTEIEIWSTKKSTADFALLYTQSTYNFETTKLRNYETIRSCWVTCVFAYVSVAELI